MQQNDGISLPLCLLHPSRYFHSGLMRAGGLKFPSCHPVLSLRIRKEGEACGARARERERGRKAGQVSVEECTPAVEGGGDSESTRQSCRAQGSESSPFQSLAQSLSCWSPQLLSSCQSLQSAFLRFTL
eukprot:1529954-Rhodomonas_salina.3